MAVAMIFDILLDNNVFEYAKLSTECAYHLSKFFVLELYFCDSYVVQWYFSSNNCE